MLVLLNSSNADQMTFRCSSSLSRHIITGAHSIEFRLRLTGDSNQPDASRIPRASSDRPVIAGTQQAARRDDPTALTLAEAASRVRRRAVSPVDLVRACLERIERLNPKLNAYITVASEQALTRARKAEREPWRGPLTASRWASKISLTLPVFGPPPQANYSRTGCLTPMRKWCAGSKPPVL